MLTLGSHRSQQNHDLQRIQIAYPLLRRFHQSSGGTPDKYDEYFALSEKGLSAVLVMAVGHRAKDDVFSEFKKVRRGVDELVIEIE